MTLADAGYFSEEHVAELQRRNQQVSMPDRAGPKGRPCHKDRFTYDSSTDSYICPHEQGLSFAGSKNNEKAKARLYRMPRKAASVCRGMSGLRGLHQERSAWSYPGDQSERCGVGPVSGLDGDWRSSTGVPGPAAPGRTAVRHPQEPHGIPAIRVARNGQREGRMDHVCHGLESPSALAGVAYRDGLPLEPYPSVNEPQRLSPRLTVRR